MKRLIILAAILFAVSAADAQSNRSRSEREKKSEPARKEVNRSSSRSFDNRSKATRNERSSQRSSVNRPSRSSNNRESAGRSSSRSNNESVNRSSRTRSYSGNDSRESNRSINSNNNSTRRAPSYGNRENRNSNNNRVSTERSTHNRVYNPRTGQRYESQRRSYSARRPSQVVRPAPRVHYAYKPIEYRRVHYVYRKPPRYHLVWTVGTYNEYARLYPNFDLWYYPIGYRIHTISAYDASAYIGEVARVYGEVYTTWYSRKTDEFYLYIGGPYPYQDFTIVLEGRDARRFSRNPERYFTGRHVAATGLISVFENKPEMFLKKRSQISVY